MFSSMNNSNIWNITWFMCPAAHGMLFFRETGGVTLFICSTPRFGSISTIKSILVNCTLARSSALTCHRWIFLWNTTWVTIKNMSYLVILQLPFGVVVVWGVVVVSGWGSGGWVEAENVTCKKLFWNKSGNFQTSCCMPYIPHGSFSPGFLHPLQVASLGKGCVA